ncbi:MAG TPA: hypothetical protein VGD67_00095, partial [Pseudonocardiaceae bacterium]
TALATRIGAPAEVVDSTAAVGGGGAPGVQLPSVAVAVPVGFAAALRAGTPAVVGRVHDGRCLLDLRTIDPCDDHSVAEAVRIVIGRRVGNSSDDSPR